MLNDIKTSGLNCRVSNLPFTACSCYLHQNVLHDMVKLIAGIMFKEILTWAIHLLKIVDRNNVNLLILVVHLCTCQVFFEELIILMVFYCQLRVDVTGIETQKRLLIRFWLIWHVKRHQFLDSNLPLLCFLWHCCTTRLIG